jgi:hypothetical protein
MKMIQKICVFYRYKMLSIIKIITVKIVFILSKTQCLFVDSNLHDCVCQCGCVYVCVSNMIKLHNCVDANREMKKVQC